MLPAPFAESAPPFWSGGPDPSGYYAFPARGRSSVAQSAKDPKTHSQYPITTGTSVFGIKCKDGVVIASDTLGSYGGLARYPELQRVVKVNETTVIAFSGDVADFQYLNSIIERRQIDEDIRGGGVNLRPEALHCWLTRVLYNRRSKFDPLWNTVLVGGIQNGKPFLGCVDKIGTGWKENIIATGLGANVAIPAITEELDKLGGVENVTVEQGKELLKKCIRVCYLRDCRAWPFYHVATISDAGSDVQGPFQIDANWEIAKSVKGYD